MFSLQRKESSDLGTSFTRRRFGAVVGALALGATLVAGSTTAAVAANNEGSFTSGHIDAVHVSLNDSFDQLVLGSNDEAGNFEECEYFPDSLVDASGGTPDYDFTVNNTAKISGTTWQIPADEPDWGTDPYDSVWLGFAAAGDEDPDDACLSEDQYGLSWLDIEGKTVTITLDAVEYNGSPATFGSTGDFNLDFSGAVTNGQVTVNTSPATGIVAYTFPLHSDDEAFHVHPEWIFNGAGTWDLTFHASTTLLDPLNAPVSDSAPITYEIVTTN